MPLPIQHSAMEPFDSHHFRHALSQFATGVTIITIRAADGTMLGLTATSFNSVSLQPPLVLWSLGAAASSMVAFSGSTHYVVNVLAADQSDLANRFASRIEDRFAGLDLDFSATGQPVLRGAVAWFECSNRSRYPEGDHVIFVGEVTQCEVTARAPLVYHGGAYCSAGTLPTV
ncbi:MAG: flavin reductase (DIM6/NTAB) family NADH-FMN oxidoreductase RutF [Burkholderiaceae bacterium]|jgi:flavin reductase (DIM6/NTAB) family NADH-FMN oxidoreductase RutF